MGRWYYRKGPIERIFFPGRKHSHSGGCCGCAAFLVLFLFCSLVASLTKHDNNQSNSNQRPASSSATQTPSSSPNVPKQSQGIPVVSAIPLEATPEPDPTDTPAPPIDYSRYVTEANPGVALHGPSGALGSSIAPAPSSQPASVFVPSSKPVVTSTHMTSIKHPSMAADVDSPKTVAVRAYDKQNGTHVGSYVRSAPAR